MNLNMLDYASLPLGSTRSGDCPNCGKRKFYVTRKPGGLVFVCHRASCPTAGFIADNGVQAETTASRPSGRYYSGNTRLPDDEDVRYFVERFGLREYDLDPVGMSYWIKVASDGRYYFPILDYKEDHVGEVLRRPIWDGEPKPPRRDTCYNGMPKAMTYLHDPDTTKMAWYHSSDPNIVVIVEDQVSAMRIACTGFPAVALLGTSMNLDHVRDLQRYGAKTVIFALDRDAKRKGIEMFARYGSIFRHAKVADLVQDPKDYEDDTLLLMDLGII